MSELAFQKALATLIRFPDQSCEQMLLQFSADLTPAEQDRLAAVSQDPLIQKYGKKMQYVRHREAMSILGLTKQLIPRDTLDDIYYTHFEPTRKTTDSLWLGVEFADFILSRPDLIQRIKDSAPAWTLDSLRFECAKAFVSRHIPKESDSTLPTGSVLRYRDFRILNLLHDIPAWETAWFQTGELSEPATRPMTLLFLPSHESPFYRMFEVDQNVQNFLEMQRQSPERWTTEMPHYYGDMQGVGLVH